ncbi:hypothetical protein [Mucilaginibacter dorajii]|uniref:Uncharacterized protein n=1 Tax=Mucilaginibacter dorajii TaxID=692994 RepID=A0ABP7PS82_9SPHI|nr:hypothetical protein [Mucilaginibacter dorajii]MCS3736937.1 hypothetical protein [Mucilaginibacter dorajii]
MTTTYTAVKLNQGQFLSEIEPFKSSCIPTDHIINKTVPGCGITTLEALHTKRHSIIILPNVPVIEGKVSEQNKPKNKGHYLLGVHKGIEIEHIQKYLKSDNVYKKILTTPEGFVNKVIKAFDGNKKSLLEDYFLLYDECERIITDVSYRDAITAPMKYFFMFKQKALVSATTLPFSDKRLNDFKHIVIEPNYDYSKVIKVVQTNNVLESFRRHTNDLNSEQYAIFLNSTDIILALIEGMGIRSESMVFCAQDSVKKLAGDAFMNASHILATDRIKKYTFYTSRFFSAVDIKVNHTPDIIMLTDVYFAKHSILDPFTEVVQISGRYRNGIASLTHISNFNPKLSSKSEQESRHYLDGCFDTYKGFLKSYNHETHPGSKDMFSTAISTSPVHNFFDDDEVNPFMVDNYISEERVRGYYRSESYLKEPYEMLRNHYKPTFKTEKYALGDYERLCRGTKMPESEKRKVIAHQIDKFTPRHGNYVIEPEGLRDSIRSAYPLVATLYDLVGLEGLEQTDYSIGSIKAAIKVAESNALYKRLAPFVYNVFDGQVSNSKDMAAKLTKVYKDNGVIEEAKAAHISKFYNTTRSTKDGEHVYKLLSKLW